jgi:hypothetical protein
MRRVTVLVVLIGIAVAALGAGSSARAGGDATPTLDRTYVCSVFFRGGVYLVDAHAHAGTKRGSAWARLPYAGVRTGALSGSAGNLLAWITSGRPSKGTVADQDWDTFDINTFGTVGVRRDACRQTSQPVALTGTGLRGGAASQLGSELECFTPKQVVVRVRAVLAAPGSLKPGQDFQTSHIPVRQAKLAVRTLAGKPLVYAEVRESGRTTLYAANGCRAG